MRTLSQKLVQPRKLVSSSLAWSNTAGPVPADREQANLHWQTNAGLRAGLTGSGSPRLGHDFSRIPVHPPARAIQTKLGRNEQGDEQEWEASASKELEEMRFAPTSPRATAGHRSISRAFPGSAPRTRVSPVALYRSWTRSRSHLGTMTFRTSRRTPAPGPPPGRGQWEPRHSRKALK
jgi:hypothetical protein